MQSNKNIRYFIKYFLRDHKSKYQNETPTCITSVILNQDVASTLLISTVDTSSFITSRKGKLKWRAMLLMVSVRLTSPS